MEFILKLGTRQAGLYLPDWPTMTSPDRPAIAMPDCAACRQVMSTHASVLVDSVGPPSAEVCRAAASFP
jgi:hypothetical protein